MVNTNDGGRKPNSGEDDDGILNDRTTIERRGWLTVVGSTLVLPATTTHRVRADDSEDDNGYGIEPYNNSPYGSPTEDDEELLVETGEAIEIDETAAVVTGEKTGADDTVVSVGIEYREQDSEEWLFVEAVVTSTGTFEVTLEALTPDTDYQFRAVAELEDGSNLITGDVESFTTDPVVVAVETIGAYDIDEISATLEGEIIELAGAGDATVYFEYGKAEDETLDSRSDTAVIDSTDPFTMEIDGLDPGTEYAFQVVAELDEWDTSDTGGVEKLMTDPLSVTVETIDASDIDESAATLEGELIELVGADEATVYFEYGDSTMDTLDEIVGVETRESIGEFSERITGLDPGTDYDFQARAEIQHDEADLTDTGSGDIESFRTADEQESPEIRIDFDLREWSNSVWARVRVEWSVSIENGSLDEVVSVLDDGADMNRTDVSGDSASENHMLRTRDGHGQTYEVTIVVTTKEGETRRSDPKTIAL